MEGQLGEGKGRYRLGLCIDEWNLAWFRVASYRATPCSLQSRVPRCLLPLFLLHPPLCTGAHVSPPYPSPDGSSGRFLKRYTVDPELRESLRAPGMCLQRGWLFSWCCCVRVACLVMLFHCASLHAFPSAITPPGFPSLTACLLLPARHVHPIKHHRQRSAARPRRRRPTPSPTPPAQRARRPCPGSGHYHAPARHLCGPPSHGSRRCRCRRSGRRLVRRARGASRWLADLGLLVRLCVDAALALHLDGGGDDVRRPHAPALAHTRTRAYGCVAVNPWACLFVGSLAHLFAGASILVGTRCGCGPFHQW